MTDRKSYQRRIVIIGATSAIAKQCAKIWIAQEPAELILVGRNKAKLAQMASDLRVRAPESFVSEMLADFLNEDAIQEIARAICKIQLPDIVLIAHGLLPVQEECQQNLRDCRNAIEINGISPILFTESFAQFMVAADHGSIIVIGSVAGDRGRQSNYAYGAAKGMLHRYLEGMQHRIAGRCQNFNILVVKPGPTATPMTINLQKRESLASVETVARDIVKAAEKRRQQVYTPKKWLIIMLIIRHLPSFIFNKIRI